MDLVIFPTNTVQVSGTGSFLKIEVRRVFVCVSSVSCWCVCSHEYHIINNRLKTEKSMRLCFFFFEKKNLLICKKAPSSNFAVGRLFSAQYRKTFFVFTLFTSQRGFLIETFCFEIIVEIYDVNFRN